MNIPEYREDLEQQGVQLQIPNDPIELNYELSLYESNYRETLEKIWPSESGEVAQTGKVSVSDTSKGKGTHYFKAARYSPTQYIRPEVLPILKERLEKEDNVDLNLLTGRQSNTAAFMRRLLVARFESSVYAFQQTLQSLIDSSNAILRWIDMVQKVPIYKKGNLPDVEDFYDLDSDELDANIELLDRYKEKGFFEIDLQDLSEEFVEDVISDIELLQEIQKSWFGSKNQIQFDPKLEGIKIILKEMLEKEPERKIVIFTQYSATAQYLYDQLKDDSIIRPFKYSSADASTTNKRTIMQNFDANVPTKKQKDEYQVLIATDAISEGYNLHRAGTIINYDIPYNPTRLIQRIGRINRVNKKVFDQLYIYNYFPSEVGEKEVQTIKISSLKLTMIHAIMGEDTKVLSKDEEVQSFFVQQYRSEMNKSEVESWDSQYRRILNQAKGTPDYKAALRIPMRARTSRASDVRHQNGVVVMGKRGEDYIFKFMAEGEEEVQLLTPQEALALFYATTDEPTLQLTPLFDPLYEKLKDKLFYRQLTNNNDTSGVTAKLKALRIVSKDADIVTKEYLQDLEEAHKLGGLAGYELRLINKVTPDQLDSLQDQITHQYIDRIIETKSKAQTSEEALILSEEIRSISQG